MAEVYLLPVDPSRDESHWANSFGILRRAFCAGHAGGHVLAVCPQSADVIILCGPARNPAFPLEMMLNPVVREFKSKCLRLSTEDYELPWMPGFYTSLPRRHRDERYFEGGIYPHVSEMPPDEPFPLDPEPPFLFSFFGSFENHPVRSGIGALADPRGWIRDTAGHPGNLTGQSADSYDEFKRQYFDSIARSKFILCPRGRSPSSIRIFEAMKARRVPVVISDDWVRPSSVPWDDFCIFISETDVGSIPGVLRELEGEFADRAATARSVWERRFSRENLAETITSWALELLAQARGGDRSAVPFSSYSWRLREWHFWRRGVIPEIRYRAGRWLV